MQEIYDISFSVMIDSYSCCYRKPDLMTIVHDKIIINIYMLLKYM